MYVCVLKSADEIANSCHSRHHIHAHTLHPPCLLHTAARTKKKVKGGGGRQTLYNSQENNELSPSLPYLSLALKPSANCECEQNGTACLLYCCEQTRQRFSPPIHFNLPFLAINPGHTPAPSVPLHPRHIQPTLPRTPARQQQSSFVCSRRATPPLPPLLRLPPHPDLDDVGWRGWRHASTGTPEQKGRGWMNAGGGGGWRWWIAFFFFF